MTETNETHVTLTGAAPALIRALRQATESAERNGRAWFGVEDVLAVLLDENKSALRHYATQRGLVDQLDAISELAQSIVPGSANEASTPVVPVGVEFTITGPDAAELEASIRA
ncbi:hypothetical protein BOX37_22410 [Nocardia mangyaensis]|jgi:hypothetical protein|uniref:Clp R domain-containing protein n=1 Tax=Nocardia mangyaensis TaxID=2213200 RepID=A0A1J0VVY3_9NOCA|nr:MULTISPECIES: hypothetical protein [Nocardia]APE36219.1 hypothetical protein BOX37_22410 [Nocardia mangyaensis]